MAEWQHLCESYGRYLSSAHAGRLYDMGIQALQFYNASAWEALWATPSPSWNWGPVPNIEPTSPTNGGVGGTRALAHSIYHTWILWVITWKGLKAHLPTWESHISTAAAHEVICRSLFLAPRLGAPAARAMPEKIHHGVGMSGRLLGVSASGASPKWMVDFMDHQ